MNCLDVFCNTSDIDAVNPLLQKIVDSIHDGIYILDVEGRFVIFNKALEDMIQLKRNKYIGTKAVDLVKKGLIDHSITQRVISSKKAVIDFQTVMGGVTKELMITSTPLLDENGDIQYIVANLKDITELNKTKLEREAAQMIIKEYNLEEAKKQYIDNYVVSKSNGMRNVINLAQRASQSSSTIILSGESGTGKEIIAKLIHSISPRKSNPFISINCAAIPENLLESELFGYEKGAFTDANTKGKIGLLELANKGTLFLDEINSLPLSLQGKILRFIETLELTRLGGTTSIKIDVRIITATNTELKTMVDNGNFREDLYFRLNVIPIDIPPLRDRKEDIIPLCMLFLSQNNKKIQREKTISVKALNALESYKWPGNVRELRNIIERIVVMSTNDIITYDDLPLMVIENKDKSANYKITVNKIVPLNEIIDEAERILIKKAYEEFSSTRKIAKTMGISQTSVVRKLKKYNIT